jgi:hypothetical protein
LESDLLHKRSREAGRIGSDRPNMLRITIHESSKTRTIKLEGKIAGPWVEEFNRAWRSLVPLPASRELHLDLRGVAFVDAEGRHLLREIYKKSHACFLADSPLMQHFTEEATQQSTKHATRGD